MGQKNGKCDSYTAGNKWCIFRHRGRYILENTLFLFLFFKLFRSARSEKSPCPNLKHKSLLLLSECLARCGVNSVDLKMQKRVNNDEFGRY